MMYTSLRATLRADLIARVGEKVAAEGRTLPEVLDELLTAWLEGKTPAKARASRARARKGT
jgi:hypothetical protein